MEVGRPLSSCLSRYASRRAALCVLWWDQGMVVRRELVFQSVGKELRGRGSGRGRGGENRRARALFGGARAKSAPQSRERERRQTTTTPGALSLPSIHDPKRDVSQLEHAANHHKNRVRFAQHGPRRGTSTPPERDALLSGVPPPSLFNARTRPLAAWRHGRATPAPDAISGTAPSSASRPDAARATWPPLACAERPRAREGLAVVPRGGGCFCHGVPLPP